MLISTEPDAVTVEVGAALATHRLTGALGRLTRTEDVCMLALQFAVRLVPSRVASFALSLTHRRRVAHRGHTRVPLDPGARCQNPRWTGRDRLDVRTAKAGVCRRRVAVPIRRHTSRQVPD